MSGGAPIPRLRTRHTDGAGNARAQPAKLSSYVAILPGVEVRHLASHVLALALKRLPGDWQQRYGYQPWLVETFVDRDRFAGTAYGAANWRRIGPTQGRGRQGPDPRVRSTSIKEVFVYPLHRQFRQRLQTLRAASACEMEAA